MSDWPKEEWWVWRPRRQGEWYWMAINRPSDDDLSAPKATYQQDEWYHIVGRLHKFRYRKLWPQDVMVKIAKGEVAHG